MRAARCLRRRDSMAIANTMTTPPPAIAARTPGLGSRSQDCIGPIRPAAPCRSHTNSMLPPHQSHRPHDRLSLWERNEFLVVTRHERKALAAPIFFCLLDALFGRRDE